MPERPTNSATAAAAVATVSMRLGNVSSVVSTVTTPVHDLSESHCARTLAAFSYHQTLLGVRGCNMVDVRVSRIDRSYRTYMSYTIYFTRRTLGSSALDPALPNQVAC